MFEKGFQATLAGIRLMYLKAVAAKGHCDKSPNDGVVVNHQNVVRARHVNFRQSLSRMAMQLLKPLRAR